MTPLKVSFTGLEFDPATLINRVHQGVFPEDWQRYRFEAKTPISQINRWLTDNIDGRWAILSSYGNGQRWITIAFEHDYDSCMFVLSNGPQQCADNHDRH